MPAVPYKQLVSKQRGTDSETIRTQVAQARGIQRDRQGELINAELSGKMLDKTAVLDETAQMVLEQAMTELGLSARAYDKVRRVSRTIADLEQVQIIQAHHVAEAAQYRLLDRIV